MGRLIALVVLAVFLSQPAVLSPTGLASASAEVGEAGDDGCSQPCPGGDDNGTCPPDCAYCVCCPGVRPILPAAPQSPSMPVARIAFEPLPVQEPASADPRGVFHVPKNLLS